MILNMLQQYFNMFNENIITTTTYIIYVILFRDS